MPNPDRSWRLVVALSLALLAACASNSKTITPEPAAKPNVNLAGFPPAFKEGYSDGCSSARAMLGSKKDETRFKSDAQYAQGWRDGYDMCKSR